MKTALLALSLAMLATGTVSRPVDASPLDRDTLACELARDFPTDGNIEACTGEPLAFPASPSFALLVTAYTEHGPVVHLLANRIDALTCTDNLTQAIAPYAGAILAGYLEPTGEGHIPAPGEPSPEPAAIVLSCEMAW